MLERQRKGVAKAKADVKYKGRGSYSMCKGARGAPFAQRGHRPERDRKTASGQQGECLSSASLAA
jgi:DNA invertase Pin-like site-specific DNA recombinase